MILTPFQLAATPHEHIRLDLSIVSSRAGDVVVGWEVTGLVDELPISIGATPPCTRQDLSGRAQEVLHALLEAAATLHDWPPFD